MKTWNRVSQCLVVAALIVAMVGCASTTGGGGAAKVKAPTDEEMIQQMMIDVMAALTAKDVDKMVSYYADDFTSDNGDKAATVAFLNGAKDQGFLDGIVVKTDAMTIAVEGETAKVGPVNLEGAFGALGLNFGLAKRDGKWLVVSQSTQM
ncbi:MAG TPA: hypothetical protein VHR17_04280 [Thermoanaerobaculia bacterium]|jgi:hypothetical protein|nr:hypothetical protein [Thermoanaerobaculia bacterium]